MARSEVAHAGPALPGLALRALVTLVTLAALTACGGSKGSAPQAPPPLVEVAPVLRQDVEVPHEWIGTLDGSINAEIRPQVQGYVLERSYREGEFVHKGETLFKIDPRQFQSALEQAQSQLAREQAALARAKIDVARFTPLVADKAVSQQELDNAVAAERGAEATVAAAQAAVNRERLNMGWTRVVSPIDGIAGAAAAQVGNLVNGGTLMAIVSAVDPIKAYFSLSESEYMAWARKYGAMDRPGGAPGPRGCSSSSCRTARWTRTAEIPTWRTGTWTRRPGPSRWPPCSPIPTICCVRDSTPRCAWWRRNRARSSCPSARSASCRARSR
jgi:biotin carboxyl carrier protein